MGAPNGAPWWRIDAQWPLLIVKGDSALTKCFLWVRFPVGAGSSHTKDFNNGSGPC